MLLLLLCNGESSSTDWTNFHHSVRRDQPITWLDQPLRLWHWLTRKNFTGKWQNTEWAISTSFLGGFTHRQDVRRSCLRCCWDWPSMSGMAIILQLVEPTPRLSITQLAVLIQSRNKIHTWLIGKDGEFHITRAAVEKGGHGVANRGRKSSSLEDEVGC